MRDQAVELQGPLAMENHHSSIVGLLNEHFQCSIDELAFWLHTVHAVAEENDIELLTVTICGAASVAVRNEELSTNVRRSLETGQRGPWA